MAKVKVQIDRPVNEYGIETEPTYAEVDEDAAGHWDETRWHDKPPGT